MKEFIVCVLLISFIAGLALIFGNAENSVQATGEQAAYLRVHIRANSNSKEDQSVKYMVRDRVVAFLTPTVADCATKDEAIQKIGAKLKDAERVAEEVLRENGYSYGARASIRKEEFPTRIYDGVTLTAGVYDALILELGTGVGDNWWCVVYPPLCFASGNQNVIYKSKIAEIIDRFFCDREKN